jgi:hypothetical protein
VTQFWTSRAWTDSHGDGFTRNVVAVQELGDDPAAAEYNALTANAVPVTWPTLDEVLRWDAQNSYPVAAGGGPSPASERYQLALDAAVTHHANRCGLLVRPVDADGAIDPTGAAVPIPSDVKLATIMRACRWARRSKTPDGLAGSSEIGALIRTSSSDPDIEAMLAPHLKLGLA